MLELSASGGLRPLNPLTRDFAPGPHWGVSPPDPHIGSRSALAMFAPNPQILATPLAGVIHRPYRPNYHRHQHRHQHCCRIYFD
jgi:hypothetical protein